MVETSYGLPSKVPAYLRRLRIEYHRSGEALLAEIVDTARADVVAGVEFDGWNGERSLHDVFLTLPPTFFAQVGLNEQENLAQRIVTDLNQCARGVPNEGFSGVYLELDPNERAGVGAFADLPPDRLGIWKPGLLRLFVSHRDRYKREANLLALELEGYGISCFVAHDTIEPLSSWQDEILKGLETMEAMLAFVTDDFNESPWTQQEIGYALGKKIPVMSLKLEKSDPTGFIGRMQALKGRIENPAIAASDVYRLIIDKVDRSGRVREALISAFVNSPDFNETRSRFERLEAATKHLSAVEVQRIVEGFRTNDQLYSSGYLNSKYRRMVLFLEERTNKRFQMEGRNIVERV